MKLQGNDWGQLTFVCGSTLYKGKGFQNFNQTDVCREMEFANKHIDELTNACESFRDSILHESGPLEVNYVLGTFDSMIGSKL